MDDGFNLLSLDEDLSFCVLCNDLFDCYFFSFNCIWVVFQDCGGVIWVGMQFGGVSWFNLMIGYFLCYCVVIGLMLLSDMIVLFLEIDDGMLWVGSVGGGFDCVDFEICSVCSYGIVIVGL